MQFVMMNFYIELSLMDAVLHPKKVKGYLEIDAELRRQKVRGLKQKGIEWYHQNVV